MAEPTSPTTPRSPRWSHSSLSKRNSENKDDYVAPEAKSIEELLSTEGKEGEDEALQRYKASLLGTAAVSGAAKSNDARRAVINELAILINGRDPLRFDMSNHEALLTGGLTVKLKEGCEYRTQLTFTVQNEIVSGLKYKNAVSRGPIPILKTDEMLGSYAPDPKKPNVAVFPRREWDKAPSGMMARGTYSAKTSFVDDDGTSHLTFSYKLVIGKDW